MTLDGTLGFELVSATRDEVVIEYTIDERHHQPYGIVHGGVHCAAVESACSTGAGIDAVARGLSVVGVENHTSFVHAVRSGRVRVVATPISRGRRAQLWEATARDADGGSSRPGACGCCASRRAARWRASPSA